MSLDIGLILCNPGERTKSKLSPSAIQSASRGQNRWTEPCALLPGPSSKPSVCRGTEAGTSLSFSDSHRGSPNRDEDILKRHLCPSLRLSDYWYKGPKKLLSLGISDWEKGSQRSLGSATDKAFLPRKISHCSDNLSSFATKQKQTMTGGPHLQDCLAEQGSSV